MRCGMAWAPCPPQDNARLVPTYGDGHLGAQPVAEEGPPRCRGPSAAVPCPRAPAQRWAPYPWLGTPPTDGQQGRGLGDPCRVYRVVCQALPLPERARPALACDLHYYERRSNMRPAARGAPFLYVGRT